MRLDERFETRNRKKSTIVITVGNKVDIFKFVEKKFRFEGSPKVIGKYWEARPSFVYITCLDMGHD